MADAEYPVNRSDANHPEEVNPWKNHVVESDKTHKHPNDIRHPGENPSHAPTPRDHRAVGGAGKRVMQYRKTLNPEMTGEMDRPGGLDLDLGSDPQA